jgi:hypothetical protein
MERPVRKMVETDAYRISAATLKTDKIKTDRRKIDCRGWDVDGNESRSYPIAGLELAALNLWVLQ